MTNDCNKVTYLKEVLITHAEGDEAAAKTFITCNIEMLSMLLRIKIHLLEF